MEKQILHRDNAVIYWVPNSTNVVLIAPALGTGYSFYRPIAEHFTKQGFSVVLFEYKKMFYEGGLHKYRGVPSIELFGKSDIKKMIALCEERFPDQQLFLLGHSIAGQVFPLADNANKLMAACIVSSQCLDWRLWEKHHKIKVFLFWYLTLPISILLYGYLPYWVYGGKYNLTAQIGWDWARNARRQGGLRKYSKENERAYQYLQVPTKFISMEDDHLIAPLPSMMELMNSYGSSMKEHLHITRRLGNLKRLGHFDFFRKENSALWDQPIAWFEKIGANNV